MKYPSSLAKLIESYQRLPSIGPKTAERLALYTVTVLDKSEAITFSQNLVSAVNSIKKCTNCGMITDLDVCEVCSDDTREKVLVIVDSPKDVIVFEKTNQFNGYYHVLNGLISPLSGVGPEDINLSNLPSRIISEGIEEVIIATSATIEGEMTALYISNILETTNVKVTRIGYGLPAGGDIEYADEITLIKALEGRRKM